MKVKQKQIIIFDHQEEFLINKRTYCIIKRLQINTVEQKKKKKIYTLCRNIHD